MSDEPSFFPSGEPPSRPLAGTWMIVGLLLAYILIAWGIVSFIFLHRA